MKSTPIGRDFEELLCAFTDGGVRFLVVGGYAVSSHGYPRATKDLDLWIEASPANARRAWQALANFGMPLGDIRPADLAAEGPWLQFGRAPGRVDILTSIDAVKFAEAWTRRSLRPFGSIRVPVLSLDDLIRNKRAAGRLQDLADAERLDRIRGGSGEGRVSERGPRRRRTPSRRRPMRRRRR